MTAVCTRVHIVQIAKAVEFYREYTLIESRLDENSTTLVPDAASAIPPSSLQTDKPIDDICSALLPF